MATAADKFARLSALRPVRNNSLLDLPHPITARTTEPLPQTEEECMLARMIGATVAQTKFGNHLSVRNWHATPEFCSPAAGVIELLRGSTSHTKSRGIKPLLHKAVIKSR